ncbi:MAG: Kelch repeat-containing protein [Planctomycetota bacterium]
MPRALLVLLLLALPISCSGGGAGNEDGGPDALAITPSSLPDGTVGRSYFAQLSARGGSGAGYVWNLGSGSLPPGVGGLPAGGATASLTGTLTTAGNYGFEVEVRDSVGATTKIFFSVRIASSGGGGGNTTTVIGAPSARGSHTSVWTGTEMIVWGGIDTFGFPTGGGAYDPTTDSWRSLATANAPAGRIGHTAIWSGTEMIVWGGADGAGPRSDGAAYDPALDRWRALATANAPIARSLHTAVWTGSRMLVWGGQGVFPPPAPNAVDRVFADGGSYDPVLDTWTAISTAGPAVRGHTAVWSGSRMIVWGGRDSFALTISPVNIGGVYDPGADSWSPTSQIVPPSARTAHSAVWSGVDMIVWGGFNAAFAVLANGRRYTPSIDRWASMSSSFAPPPSQGHTAVWTGNQMIVWGGTDAGGRVLGSGGTYAPGSDRWGPIPAGFAPQARADHTAVWTGFQMIVWGGRAGAAAYLNTGALLTP